MKKALQLSDGSFIAYEESGRGKPIVLVHGFTGNSGGWEKSLAALGKHYHVYAYDLIGHGETFVADDSAVYSSSVPL